MKKNHKVLLGLCCIGQLIISTSCKKILSQETIVENTLNAKVKTPDAITYNDTLYNPGDTIYGYKHYIKLVVGDNDCPLLLGVPHDGISTGNPVIPETGDTGRDLNTKPLAFKIASTFTANTGKRPWIIINEIGRKRVDPNTYPDEVSSRYTDQEAVNTYNSYHELLQMARSAMLTAQTGGNGALFVDIHGHAHQYTDGHTEPYVSTTSGSSIQSAFIDQTEVGYGLSNYSLEKSDTYLDALADSSSIGAISRAHPNVAFSELIRGDHSFGGLLEAQNVHAVPGNVKEVLDRNFTLFGGTTAKPARRPYFNGGYCTRKYGTILTGSTIGFNDNISALQIETPGITIRNNTSIINISGPRIKKAIIAYLNYWYGYSYPNT
jgi:hypothetical protein